MALCLSTPQVPWQLEPSRKFVARRVWAGGLRLLLANCVWQIRILAHQRHARVPCVGDSGPKNHLLENNADCPCEQPRSVASFGPCNQYQRAWRSQACEARGRPPAAAQACQHLVAAPAGNTGRCSRIARGPHWSSKWCRGAPAREVDATPEKLQYFVGRESKAPMGPGGFSDNEGGSVGVMAWPCAQVGHICTAAKASFSQ